MVSTSDASAEGPGSAPPLVSIVFLTYNQEKYVKEALEGLLSQTYLRLDIIITDDASTDATAELIAAELAKRPHRSDIRFIRNQKNLGGLDAAISSMRCHSRVANSSSSRAAATPCYRGRSRTWREEYVSLVTANALYIDP